MPSIRAPVHRQHVAQEVVDVPAKLLGGRPLHHVRLGDHLRPAPVRLQDRLDVELLLAAEVVIDRRQVRPRPFADRPDPRSSNPFSANSSPAASSNLAFVSSAIAITRPRNLKRSQTVVSNSRLIQFRQIGDHVKPVAAFLSNVPWKDESAQRVLIRRVRYRSDVATGDHAP